VTVDWTVLAVGKIAHQFGLSARAVERLFREYVGVGPMWVIKRRRLHDAVDQMAAGEAIDWPQLATELGYFDQAHFITTFGLSMATRPESTHATNADARAHPHALPPAAARAGHPW
jgi:AraC-like DNA-binding protein